MTLRSRIRDWRRDDGVSTVETLLWAAVAVLMLGIAVYVIRGTSASIDAADAAQAAARAASLQTSPQLAIRAARATASADLDAADSACRTPRTSVDVSRFRPGGTVSVTVSCTVTAAGLPISGIGNRQLTATASAPIDLYKVVTP